MLGGRPAFSASCSAKKMIIVNQPPPKHSVEPPVRFVERHDCPVCHKTDFRTVMVCDFADEPIASELRRLYDRNPERLRGWNFHLEQCTSCECIFQKWKGDEAFLDELYTFWL